MHSLNDSSKGFSESLIDVCVQTDPYKFFYDSVDHAVDSSPSKQSFIFKPNDTILVLLSGRRSSDIVAINIYQKIQTEIDSLVVVRNKEQAEEFNDENIHSEYKFMTDKIYSIDKIDAILSKILKNKPDSKMLIIDCFTFPNGFWKSKNIINIMFNARHYGITLVVILRDPKNISPELRSNFDHVVVSKNDSTSVLKQIWDQYFGILRTYNIFVELQQYMNSDDILHLVNKSTCNTLNDRIAIYPMYQMSQTREIKLTRSDLIIDDKKEDILESKIFQQRLNKIIDDLILLRTDIGGVYH